MGAVGTAETTAGTSGAGDTVEVEVKPLICLPFKGKEGDKIIGQFRNSLAKVLPPGIKPRFAYKGKKIGSFFRIKDPVPIEHESDLIYAFQKEEELKYIGETKVRNGTRQHTVELTRNRPFSSTRKKKGWIYTQRTLKSWKRVTLTQLREN